MALRAPIQNQRRSCLVLTLIFLCIVALVAAGVFTYPSILKALNIDPGLVSQGIGVENKANNELIGISDGTYAFDIASPRNDVNFKVQAATRLKQGDRNGAVALWSEGIAKDTNDAEALIYQEDQLVLASGKPYITLVIGTTLTGNNASAISTGRDVLQGAYVAQKEANDNSKLNGGKQLRLLIANAGSQSDYATDVAQQIVQAAKQDRTILGIMGWPFSSYTLKAVGILSNAGIPMVSPTASSNKLTGISRFFFRVAPSDKSQAVAGAQYVEQQLHVKKVALFVDPTDAYSNSLASAFRTQFEADGNQIVVTENYQVGKTQALPGLLQKALQFNPELVYFSGYSSDLGVLLAAQPEMQVMGGDALYELGGYSSSARAGFVHLHFTAFAYPDEWLAKNLTPPPFFSMYSHNFDPLGQHTQNPYGYDRPTSDNILAYDAMLALVQGCNNALNTGNTILTPDALERGLSRITGAQAVQGVSGQIAFGSDGDPIKKAVVVLYVDSGFIKIANSNGIQGCFLVKDCN
ncbi:MAG TPA: ABC transporter substrate-binding protein [Ktedonobacteraceae bacterium]|nr:ABC transporter substrate-binding protein [Ktedonobacteraceae bacterium]